MAGSGLLKPSWAPNVEEFHKRFDPEKTKGQGTRKIHNIYQCYKLTKHSVLRRQCSDANRNIKRLVYCRHGYLVKSNISSVGLSSERNMYMHCK